MPRIERSRTYIADALLSLLKTKKFQDISINDIINKAGVSRMTFYRQFYDKKEVLKYILDTRTDEYIASHKKDNAPIEERILQGVSMILEKKELALLFYYYIPAHRTESDTELTDIIIKTLDLDLLKEELEKRKS